MENETKPVEAVENTKTVEVIEKINTQEMVSPVWLQTEKIAEKADLSGYTPVQRPVAEVFGLIWLNKRTAKDGTQIWRVHREGGFYHWVTDYSQASSVAASLYIPGDNFKDDGR